MMKTQSLIIISLLILYGVCQSFAIDCYVCLDPECWNQTLSSNQPGDYFGKIEKCDSDKSCYTAKVGDVYGIEDVTLRGCKNLPPGVEDGDCKFEQREEEIIVKSSDLTTTFDFSKKYGESCYCTTDKCNTGTVFVTTTTTTTVSTSSPPVISTSTVNSTSATSDSNSSSNSSSLSTSTSSTGISSGLSITEIQKSILYEKLRYHRTQADTAEEELDLAHERLKIEKIIGYYKIMEAIANANRAGYALKENDPKYIASA